MLTKQKKRRNIKTNLTHHDKVNRNENQINSEEAISNFIKVFEKAGGNENETRFTKQI